MMLFEGESEKRRCAVARPIPEEPPVMRVVEECGPVRQEGEIVNASVGIMREMLI